MKIINAALMAVAAFLLMSLPALAQDTTVNLGELLDPWLQLVLAFFAVVIPALGAWAAAELHRRTGIAIQQAHMNTFQQSLTNAAGLLVSKGRDAAGGVNIDVKSRAVAEAIRYVNSSAPDAIAYFGLTPEAIAEKIVAKLGVTAPAPVVNNTTQL